MLKMPPVRWARPQQTDDALAPYRARSLQSFAVVGTVFMVPFAVNNFVQGYPVLAVLLIAAMAILVVDAWAIHRKRRPPVPIGLIILPTLVGVALTVRMKGMIGVFWPYPLVLLFHCTLPRRAANGHSTLLLLLVVPLTARYVDTSLAIRMGVTLVLTIVLANVFLGIIDDLHAKLVAQASVDPLTGALNRREMERHLGDAVERHGRTGAPASLLVLDIDHFKAINDGFGHAAGDAVLTNLVTLLTRRARRLDRVFRTGGEEFMVCLPDTVEGDAAVLAESLRAAIAAAPLLDGGRRRVTVSIGVAALRPGDSVDTWKGRSDAAMYAAKGSGRDRVVRAGEMGPSRADDADEGESLVGAGGVARGML